MQIIKIILSVIFIIDCIALTVVVLMQEGKQQGLGAIAGAAETYWGKNKGRSMEGGLVKATTIMGILFFVISHRRHFTLYYAVIACNQSLKQGFNDNRSHHYYNVLGNIRKQQRCSACNHLRERGE